jgi:hypothetical protein
MVVFGKLTLLLLLPSLIWSSSVFAQDCDHLSLIKKIVRQEEQGSQVFITQPVFFSMNPACHDEVLNSEVEESVTQFRQAYFAVPEKKIGDQRGYLTVNYRLLNNAKGVVSVKLTAESFYAGFAHPRTDIETINVDIREGKVLTLSTIFGSEVILPWFSMYAKADLEQRFSSNSTGGLWIEKGTLAIPQNYQYWNLTPEGLLITFLPYQIGSRPYGSPTVLLPYGVLKELDFGIRIENKASI